MELHQPNDLPETVSRILQDFTESAKAALGENLKSVVLYGSAAEGRLRRTSDVNLILVFKEFKISQIDELREKLRLAHAAIQLNVMFLLESELSSAMDSFAVKFSDIISRHRVLFGTDVFNHIKTSREATLQRLKQVLLNLTLRLRERYALISLREEKLAMVIAEVAGPLRACAATVLTLDGQPPSSPKEALRSLSQRLSGGSWETMLTSISTAREEREMKPGEAVSTVLDILQLLQAMNEHIQRLE